MTEMKKGFSLVEIMLVLAALGGVALLVTKLGKSTMEIQNGSLIMNDYNDLVREAHFLLADSKSCQASLAGLTFVPNSKDGLIKDIELWKSDSKGFNKVKKIIAKTEKYKSLNIEEMTLSLDEVSLTGTKSLEPQNTTGTFKIKVNTQSGRTPLSEIEHHLSINFSVDPVTNLAKIINCDSALVSDRSVAKVWCGTLVNPCGTETLSVVGVGRFLNGQFTGVFQSTTPVDFKVCGAAKNHPANLNSCEN